MSRAPPGGADGFERGLRHAALHSRARGGAVISTAKDPGGTRGLTVVFGPLTVAHDLTGGAERGAGSRQDLPLP